VTLASPPLRWVRHDAGSVHGAADCRVACLWRGEVVLDRWVEDHTLQWAYLFGLEHPCM
jgi:hypothetical protein